MLWPFLARLRETPPEVIPPEVMAWAHGIGLSGRSACFRSLRLRFTTAAIAHGLADVIPDRLILGGFAKWSGREV